jgi:putative transposase
MKVFSIAKGFHKLWKDHLGGELSQKERDRLRAITLFQHTKDASLVGETFGISRATLYRWVKQCDTRDPSSLKEKSRRPRRVRKPEWSKELVQAVRDLREQYPRWGKDKLAVLLARTGWHASVSTVGRIMTSLKKRGQLAEPKGTVISAKRRVKRFYAVRKPRGYPVQYPGDLVQIDTLDVRPLPSVIFKQFTARDMVSRWDVIEVRSVATARTAAEFLITLDARMPFPLRAIQVDGGSEFYADFESACKEKGILLYVLPPKSPKLNGHVERANRTHTEEFYEVYPTTWTVRELNEELQEWERTYNCIRPHQSLGYKTPLQFLQECGILHTDSPSGLSHM